MDRSFTQESLATSTFSASTPRTSRASQDVTPSPDPEEGEEINDELPSKRLRRSLESEAIDTYFQNTGDRPAPGKKWNKRCIKCEKEYAGNTQNLMAHLNKCPNITPQERSELFQQPEFANKYRSNIQSMADRALVELIAECNLPFSLVGHHKFVEYSLILNDKYSVPSPRTLIRSIFTAQNSNLVKAMTSEIEQTTARSATISFDTWSDALGHSIMAFYLTLYKDLSKKLYIYRLVDVSLMEHSGAKIGDLLQNVIEEIGGDKINCIISDNASDVSLARKNVTASNPGIISLGCLAHWLNLLAKDICRNERIQTRVGQATRLIKYIKKRTYLRNILSQNSVALQTFTEIRWYSLCASLGSLLKNEVGIKERLDSNKNEFKSKVRSIICDHEFWFEIHSIHNLLDKICEAIGMAESFSKLSVSETIHKILVLGKTLKTCERINDFNRIAINAYYKRIASKPDLKIFIMAYGLDPRFKAKYLTKKSKDTIRKEVVVIGRLILKLKKTDLIRVNADLIAYFNNAEPYSCKFRQDPIRYWEICSKEVATSDIVKRFLKIDGSTADVERGFSQLKLMQGLNRHLLSVSTLEILLRFKLSSQQDTEKVKKNGQKINFNGIMDAAMLELDGVEPEQNGICLSQEEDDSFIHRILLKDVISDNLTEIDNNRFFFEAFFDLEDDLEYSSDDEESENLDYSLGEIDPEFSIL